MGPCSIDEIKRRLAAGTLTPETRVWTATQGDKWLKASEVPDLKVKPRLRLAQQPRPWEPAPTTTAPPLGMERGDNVAASVVYERKLKKAELYLGKRMEERASRRYIEAELLTQGLRRSDVDRLLDEAFQGLNADYRKKGLLEIGTTIGLWLLLFAALVLRTLLMRKPFTDTFMLLCLLVAVMGTFWLFRGFLRLVFGSKRRLGLIAGLLTVAATGVAAFFVVRAIMAGAAGAAADGSGSAGQADAGAPGNLTVVRPGHYIQVWKAPASFARRGVCEIRIQHAAAGSAGAFRFTVWTDLNRDGRPDTEMVRSTDFSARRAGDWSTWTFNLPGGVIFVGNGWPKSTTKIFYQTGGRTPAHCTELGDTVFYSRDPAGTPASQARPRFTSIQLRFVGER